MEQKSSMENTSLTPSKSKDSIEYLIKHSKLQPWQKEVWSSFMEAQKEPMRLVVYGRQCGKTELKNEYIRLIGKLTEEAQDQSETD